MDVTVYTPEDGTIVRKATKGEEEAILKQQAESQRILSEAQALAELRRDALRKMALASGLTEDELSALGF